MATADRPAFRFAVVPSVEGMDCGCGACPECRPGVAEAAVLVEMSFHEVLDLCNRSQDATLSKLLALRKPPTTRAEARRLNRTRQRANRGGSK